VIAQLPTPVIFGDGSFFPFSRGVLTKSLVAAGLSVEQAYDLACKVHRLLIEKGKPRYGKSELKQIVISELSKSYGELVARSYSRRQGAPPHLMVDGPGTSFPFSKGLLTLSVQASGVNTETAFNVARLVEAELQKSGRSVVTRDQIRRMTGEFLEAIAGQEYAKRYFLWRELKGATRPVIILIGGGTGTGKSTVAAELGRYLGFMRVISTDTVRQIMRTLFSDVFVPSIHESSYCAYKALNVPLPDATDPVLFGFREQATRICVGVRAIIRRAIEEGVSIILDGVHLVPGFFAPEEFSDLARISWVMLAVTDQASHRARFSLRESTAGARLAKRYLENFDAIRKIQDYVLAMARAQKTPIIENDDFELTLSQVITVISDEMMRTGKEGEQN